MATTVILTVTLTGESTSQKMWFSQQLQTTRSERMIFEFVTMEHVDINASNIKIYSI
jgi:hypothetical protein